MWPFRSKPQRTNRDESAAASRAATGERALIYVIRPTHIGVLVQTKLSADKKWLGVNRVNNYFYFTLDPGPHYLCSQEGDYHSLLSMVVEAGKTQLPATENRNDR